jgi:DNA polymerase
MAIRTQQNYEEYMTLWEEHGIETSTLSKRKGMKKPKSRPVSLKNFKSLEDIRTRLGDCKRCGLCEERNTIVFGSGNPKAKLMFIGEGPGAQEDKSGFPFVGRAGTLLTKIIEAMGLTREEVFIANIVKCRPPGNRVPTPEEIESCVPFLKAQIEVIQPKMIVALGLTAASTLTGNDSAMGDLRGRFHTLAWDSKRSLMATYHPAYLLRNPAAKKIVWEDMKLVVKQLKGR